jgi:DNA-binding GntR family transcriptional regulator
MRERVAAAADFATFANNYRVARQRIDYRLLECHAFRPLSIRSAAFAGVRQIATLILAPRNYRLRYVPSTPICDGISQDRRDKYACNCRWAGAGAMVTPLGETASRQRPVQATARRLRDMVFAAKPDTRIGSLKGLADSLGVGIVTVQQAARVLEHEGLLEVRRGPGGGYYGKRPDEAALQRAIAAFIRIHPVGYAEALDMMTLLFCELVAAAADSNDAVLRGDLAAMVGEINLCRDDATLGTFETRFQNLLFRMVDPSGVAAVWGRGAAAALCRPRRAGAVAGRSPSRAWRDPGGRSRTRPLRGGAQPPRAARTLPREARRRAAITFMIGGTLVGRLLHARPGFPGYASPAQDVAEAATG